MLTTTTPSAFFSIRLRKRASLAAKARWYSSNMADLPTEIVSPGTIGRLGTSYSRRNSSRSDITVVFEHLAQALDLAGRKVHEMARQDAGDVAERFTDVHSRAVNGELADALFVRGAAHLQYRYAAAHLAMHLPVAPRNDAIGDGRDVRFCHRCAAQQTRRGGGEQSGHVFVLDVRSQADSKLAEALDGSHALQGGQAIDGDALRPELVHDCLHGDQMVFQAAGLRIFANYLELAG